MQSIQESEKEILKFWEENKIFDKLRKRNEGKKKWSFIDGPITANNAMGVHHAWGRTYKDVFHRFKAMQGHEMRYQNGFDCQGLWVEREEEKDLGLKNKSDIEKFGVLNFVNACRKRIEKFSKIQTEQSVRLGYWMDWNNSYYTMTDTNNLHNWFLLKSYFEKGWLYKGKDAVPWCPRCGTASSKHDIATEGYKEVTHTALFMQFPLKSNPDECFLIFTTTPWTVPANVAIAVNANIDYVKVENEGLRYWIAEARVSELQGEYKIIEKKKGTELEGQEYVMPYFNFAKQSESPHKVVLWDLASSEEGTGIVHIAPGCGAEDFELGKKLGLPSISPLDDAGVYQENYEQFSLKRYDVVNKEVLEDLEQRRFVYKTIPYKHRYPHCWRCGTELVFRLVDEWYIKSEGMRQNLIEENKKVNWYPEYGKLRQEEWFKNMDDWLISRKRYWGLPLPIWECSCGNIEVIGSKNELKEKAVDKNKVDSLKEIHRPWIDEILIKCSKCEKNIERVKDVGDAWLDAGIVPFSTIGPYMDNIEEWKKWYPAELISENIPGQFRGWFNALFWSGVAITGKSPFKSLFGYETLKDEKGQEMHKSKGNAIWFNDAVDKVGADPMRLLFCLQDPSQELRFGYNVIKEPNNHINILYNLSKLIEGADKTEIVAIEDKWIMSKLNNLIKNVTEELQNLHPHVATRYILEFWLYDLSRKYIQIVRDRLASNDKAAKYVLRTSYINLIKLCAPMIPFITEKIWQDLKNKKIVSEESIHLSDWPIADDKNINIDTEKEFELLFKVIELGLFERDKSKIGLKWPLSKATVHMKEKGLSVDMLEVVGRQLNVKSVETINSDDIKIILDTEMTPTLEAEGYSREFARNIQALRKKAGLIKGQMIDIKVVCKKDIKKYLEQNIHFLKERTNANKIDFVDISRNEELSKFEIKGNEISVKFS